MEKPMDTARLHQSIRTYGEITHARSGGPGGQNVNKVNTKVTLRIKLDNLEGLSAEERNRLKETLGSRLTGAGEVLSVSSETRSQRLNLESAFARMELLLSAAARLPKRRRPSKPSKAAQEKRLQSKHRHSLKKAARRDAEQP